MKTIRKCIAILLIIGISIGLSPVNSAEAKNKNKPATPVISTVLQENGTDIKITIEKTEKAEGYSILLKSPDKKKFKSVKTLKKDGTSERSYTIKDLTEGTYSIKVKAYKTVDGKKVWSSYSKVNTVDVKKVIITKEEKTDITGTSDNSEKTTYVLNTSTKKFHRPSCSDIKKMSTKNRRDVSWDRSKVINEGYSPCGHCKP